MSGGTPVTTNNWPRHKQIAFLEHLAISSNVAASERVADVPAGAAYRFRNRSEAFRRAWEVALKTGYDRLEMSVLERAINGVVVERTTDKDGATTEKLAFSERLAMSLLAAHRVSVAAISARYDRETAKATLERKLAAMAKRLGNDG